MIDTIFIKQVTELKDRIEKLSARIDKAWTDEARQASVEARQHLADRGYVKTGGGLHERSGMNYQQFKNPKVDHSVRVFANGSWDMSQPGTKAKEGGFGGRGSNMHRGSGGVGGATNLAATLDRIKR